ncbi:hypothetical protein [Shewanella algidipiscicola]|uniref:Uncharacterized protein n=1 Tax=Shewanella algidipiscicola TaxID=614070 RepID=A0ABQ4PEU2_9GAMM|nr:hypothetical protein [Shewanella algidipiscicola]GIU46041.1 hypothetical protein TUM4630_15560 [Shewanella algidipiscicola]
MKKVFNASILAAAVALSFGASAADVEISTVLGLTNEAAAAGVTLVSAYDTDFTFYNREELSAGDIVTITFPIGTVIGSAVAQVGAGVGTFETPGVVDLGSATVAPTVKLTVAVGSPVLNNSKTVVKLTDFNPKAGNAVYTAEDGFSGEPKDTTGSNAVALTSAADQEVASVVTKLDGFVNRENRDTFVFSKGTLVGEIQITRPVVKGDTSLTAAVSTDTVVLSAKSFKDLTMKAATCSDGSAVSIDSSYTPSCAGAATVVAPVAAVVSCSDATAIPACTDTATFDVSTLTGALPTVAAPGTGKAGKISIWGEATATKDIQLTNFDITRTVTYAPVAPVTVAPKLDYIKDASFGEYQLDASVVNVPYLPVGYDLTPNVEIANKAMTDAEIILEGFDHKGNQYGPVTLTKKAAAHAVTKISEADIAAAFGITGKAKLSVTFILDADEDEITLAPYYREGESRVNVLSDQYKADSIR